MVHPRAEEVSLMFHLCEKTLPPMGQDHSLLLMSEFVAREAVELRSNNRTFQAQVATQKVRGAAPVYNYCVLETQECTLASGRRAQTCGFEHDLCQTSTDLSPKNAYLRNF